MKSGYMAESVPDTVDDFVRMRDSLARTPGGGAACLALAMLVYAKDRKTGEECLTAITDMSRLEESEDGYMGWKLRNRDLQLIEDQLTGRPWLAASYVTGTSPDTGYELGTDPLFFDIRLDPLNPSDPRDRAKVFIVSSGADSPRPLTVARNSDSIWKAVEWSSLLVGVRPPAAGEIDDI
jgi:hypothetical protein